MRTFQCRVTRMNDPTNHRRTSQEILGGRTLVCPTSGVAASDVGGSGGPLENFEM